MTARVRGYRLWNGKEGLDGSESVRGLSGKSAAKCLLLRCLHRIWLAGPRVRNGYTFRYWRALASKPDVWVTLRRIPFEAVLTVPWVAG